MTQLVPPRRLLAQRAFGGTTDLMASESFLVRSPWGFFNGSLLHCASLHGASLPDRWTRPANPPTCRGRICRRLPGATSLASPWVSLCWPCGWAGYFTAMGLWATPPLGVFSADPKKGQTKIDKPLALTEPFARARALVPALRYPIYLESMVAPLRHAEAVCAGAVLVSGVFGSMDFICFPTSCRLRSKQPAVQRRGGFGHELGLARKSISG